MSQDEFFDFEMPNFVPIFTGLVDNIANGEFTPASLGVYIVLHLHCGWDTGIYLGSSSNIGEHMGGVADKWVICDALAHLKRHNKINYPKGNGSRKGYRILINKYLVRKGNLKGWTLNAFADNSLTAPVYERANGGPTEEGRSSNGGATVFLRRANGDTTEDQRIQEYKNINRLIVEEFPNRSRAPRTRKATGPARTSEAPAPILEFEDPPEQVPVEDAYDRPDEVAEPIEVGRAPEPPTLQILDRPVVPTVSPMEQLAKKAQREREKKGRQSAAIRTPAPTSTQTSTAGPKHPVAQKLLKYAGEPDTLAEKGPEWDAIAMRLEQTYSREDLLAALDWVFATTKDFWRECLVTKAKDPMISFEKNSKEIVGNEYKRFKAAGRNEAMREARTEQVTATKTNPLNIATKPLSYLLEGYDPDPKKED